MKKFLLQFSIILVISFGLMSFKKMPKPPVIKSIKTKMVKPNGLVLEKTNIKLGFIKLTDMAPLAIAKQKGFFEAEGLNVTLEAQANWRDILDKIADGQIDGAHMLAGQIIAANSGVGRQVALVTPFSMDLNGNAITVSNDVWWKIVDNLPKEYGRPIHPIKASDLTPALNLFKEFKKPFVMGVVSQVSNHNYLLRYWLAAGGIVPGFYSQENVLGNLDGQVRIDVVAPPQMPAVLEQGKINGYCVGEPWNQQAVDVSVGIPLITSKDIWKNHPEKVFAMTKEFVDNNPNTTIAITKALIRAGKWLDNPENRREASRILSKEAYVDGEKRVIDNSMLGSYEYEKGDIRVEGDFNVFFKYNATYPYYSDGIWFLTQMKRWGQITGNKPDEWYHSKIKEIYKPEIWLQAANVLLKEGVLQKNEIPETDGYKPATTEFIDHMMYDGKKPTEYINSFKIGFKSNI
jgi:nitrate/nitrite transport system substrate-binding protein